ncbi:hypothetical protein [Sedimentibacter sp.]|uniref:hypothetical protein n=1 Tax=Sedimentibacter sp. TaxID=1960295 RepID=UPI0028ACC927|nr:hypothetical protein [Sedimentibacter sp.]
MNKKEIDFEYNMLQGNINRMFLTDDYKELNTMYLFAKRRLDEIHTYNYNRIVFDKANKKGE